MNSGFFEDDDDLNQKVFTEESKDKHGKLIPIDPEILEDISARKGTRNDIPLRAKPTEITQRTVKDGNWTPSKTRKNHRISPERAMILKIVGYIAVMLSMIGVVGFAVLYVLNTYIF